MEIRVRPKNLMQASSKIGDIEAAVKRAGATAGQVAKTLQHESDDFRIIAANLRGLKAGIDQNVKAMSQMKNSLAHISQLYEKTERSIVNSKRSKGVTLDELLKGRIPGIGKWAPFIGTLGPMVIPGSPIGGLLFWNPWIYSTLYDLLGDKIDPSWSTYADARFDPATLSFIAGAGVMGSLYSAEGKIETDYASAEGSLEVGKFEADAGFEAGLLDGDRLDPHLAAHAGIDAAALSASGKLEAGLISSEAELQVGHVSAKGEVSLSASEGLTAEASAEATAAEGKFKSSLGSDSNNIHAEMEGKALTASAEAKASITKDAVELKAGGEAYLAKGSVTEGITIAGIKIDATVSGGVGGAEATIGGKATGTSVSGKIGIGLIAGGDIEVKVDWSKSSIYKSYQKFRSNTWMRWT